MCATQHLSPRWMAWPVIEVVSAELFCQVKHSKKPVTRKPQCSLALLGPCTPHTRSLNWPGWLVWLGEMGEKLELGVEAVFVYERRRFDKIKVKVFHCFAWGKCVSDYTLHSCGWTLHESKCFYTHLKSLCWSSVYFQVYRPTFVLSVLRASQLECMCVKDSCFCNIRFLQKNLSSSLLLLRVECFILLQKLGAMISYLLALRCVCVSHIHKHTY